jgi:hypothetical protein
MNRGGVVAVAWDDDKTDPGVDLWRSLVRPPFSLNVSQSVRSSREELSAFLAASSRRKISGPSAARLRFLSVPGDPARTSRQNRPAETLGLSHSDSASRGKITDGARSGRHRRACCWDEGGKNVTDAYAARDRMT